MTRHPLLCHMVAACARTALARALRREAKP